MDHGELEVGVRVVHGLVPGLGDRDDREGHRGKQERRREPGESGLHPEPRDRPEIRRPRDDGRTHEGEEERRLDECRDRNLATAAHAPECAARIESRECEDKPAEREQSDDHEQICPAIERRASAEHGYDERGDDHGRQDDRRGHGGQPACRIALHRLLAPPLRQVAIRLQKRRAAPVLKARLHALRDAEQQRRDQE